MIMTNRSKTDIVASSMSSVTSHRFKNDHWTWPLDMKTRPPKLFSCLCWQN